jgi:hypothetical protein
MRFIIPLLFFLPCLSVGQSADSLPPRLGCWGISTEDRLALRLLPAAPDRKPGFFGAARSWRWRKQMVWPVSLGFISGAAWGTHEVIVNRNANFQRVFPNANPRFWGPESWRNKYWGFDPARGRNRTPIYLTDGKHALASITQVSGFFAGTTIMLGENRPFIHYIIDAGITFAAYTAGNVLTWDIIFR